MLNGERTVGPTGLLNLIYVKIAIPYLPQRVTLYIATLFWRNTADIPLLGPYLLNRMQRRTTQGKDGSRRTATGKEQ
jgi:hypothetical protein